VIYALLIPVVAAVVYISYAIVLWSVGQRGNAIMYVEKAIEIPLMLAVNGTIFWATNLIIISVSEGKLGDIWSAWNSMELSATRFKTIKEYCIGWVLYSGTVRSIIASTPVLSGFAEAFSAATFWSNMVLSTAATSFLFLEYLTYLLNSIKDWLLSLGVTLTPVDKLRRLGGWLLSIYLVYGTAIPLIALNIPPDLSPPGLPDYFNPVKWIIAADLMAKAAYTVIGPLVVSVTGLAIASAVAAGISSMIGGIGLTLKWI